MTERGVCGSIISRLWIGFGVVVSSWRWGAYWPSAIAGIELHGVGKSRLCLLRQERLGEKWHESVSPAVIDFYRSRHLSGCGAQAQPTRNSVSLGGKGRAGFFSTAAL